MCDSGQSETAEHVILNCVFSRSVWSSIPAGHYVLQDTNSSISIQDWTLNWLSLIHLKDHIIEVMTTSWYIWKERCSKFFQNKKFHTQTTVRYALKLSEDTKNFLINDNTSSSQQQNLVINIVANCILPHDCILVFCDASFDKNTNKVGLRIVLMDISGSYMGCKVVSGIASNLEEAENLALLEAAKWIKHKNFMDVSIKSDARILIAYLYKSKGKNSWTTYTLLDDGVFLLKGINFFKFEYLSRNFNGLANKVARHDGNLNVRDEWNENDRPRFLANSVNSI